MATSGAPQTLVPAAFTAHTLPPVDTSLTFATPLLLPPPPPPPPQSLVLDKGMAMHVGPPAIRLLPLSRLTEAKRKPFVLRPAFDGDGAAARRRIIAFARGLHRKRYDYSRAVTVLVRLCLEHQLGLRLNGRLALARPSDTKWTCTDGERFFPHDIV